MGHGAQGREAQLHGPQHIARARQLASHSRHLAGALHCAELAGQHAQHFVMPGLGKASAGAVVGDFQVGQTGCAQLLNLQIKAAAPFSKIGQPMQLAKVDFIDDGQHRNLKQDGVQPGALDGDVNVATGQWGHCDVFFVQLEQAQKIHKVAFNEAHRAQVGQLGILEMQAAQRANLIADFGHMRCKIDASLVTERVTAGLRARISALEPVLHLCPRKLVQHHLHHGELVEVGVKQAGDDHVRPFKVRFKRAV